MTPDRFNEDALAVLALPPQVIEEHASIEFLEAGSDEWKAHRALHFNGSDAGTIMAVNPNETRSEFLRRFATGHDREFSDFVRDRILARGHEIEEQERDAAEARFVADFRPCVFSAGVLSVSLDGFDDDQGMTWECKSWNEEKAKHVQAGQCPPSDLPQVQQGLMVSGADLCVYTLSDGNGRRMDVEVRPDRDYQARLLASWRQFHADLLEVDLDPLGDEKPDAVEIERAELPELAVTVSGSVLASNLDQYKRRALEIFDGISTALETDEDFAEAKETAKWIGDVEKAIASAREAVIDQTADVRKILDTLDELQETGRQKRLDLSRLVKTREQEIRSEIVQDARDALQAFVSEQAKRLRIRDRSIRLPAPPVDFPGAMKNKRLLSSIRSAVDDLLAAAKVDVAEEANRIAGNLDWLSGRDDFDEVSGLFPDLEDVARLDERTFRLEVEDRIRKDLERRQEAERRRQEAEERRRERQEAQEAERAAGNPGAAEKVKTEDVTPEIRRQESAETLWTIRIRASAATVANHAIGSILERLEGVEVVSFTNEENE